MRGKPPPAPILRLALIHLKSQEGEERPEQKADGDPLDLQLMIIALFTFHFRTLQFSFNFIHFIYHIEQTFVSNTFIDACLKYSHVFFNFILFLPLAPR